MTKKNILFVLFPRRFSLCWSVAVFPAASLGLYFLRVAHFIFVLHCVCCLRVYANSFFSLHTIRLYAHFTVIILHFYCVLLWSCTFGGNRWSYFTYDDWRLEKSPPRRSQIQTHTYTLKLDTCEQNYYYYYYCISLSFCVQTEKHFSVSRVCIGCSVHQTRTEVRNGMNEWMNERNNNNGSIWSKDIIVNQMQKGAGWGTKKEKMHKYFVSVWRISWIVIFGKGECHCSFNVHFLYWTKNCFLRQKIRMANNKK